MPSFLLEIFSEEIPARMQKTAGLNLLLGFENAMKEAGILYGKCNPFVTPRRIAIIAEDIPEIQPDITIEKKGPKTSAPQAALDGFLRKENLTVDKLEKRMVGKDETYFAVVHQKGQPTATLLKPLIEKILANFPWPKSMRWGSGETRWVRPMHSILCILGGKVVTVEFAGIKAGNVTYGHRFLAPQAITINDAGEYESKLLAAKVIADPEKRKAEIMKQAEALAAKNNLTVRRDDGLQNEVTGLVEWPNVLMGSIDAKFMDLPPEVLTSEMRAHQKYFALLNKDGSMSDKFLITSNMTTNDNGKAIIAGNERVLRARLADGRFFFDQDRKKTLEQWAEGLKNVTFHAKIGTIAEKVDRIRLLANDLVKYVPNAEQTPVVKAASLCKADLVTGMVGEFPELQGVMGRYYALHQKEKPEVADAIRDHYLPLGPDSPIPTLPVSICVALADKFDTLISMFGAGEKPTGSKDPFALRRSALGIIRIILENNLRLPLKKFLTDELLAFFGDRLKVMLRDKGIRHDVIDAVMANGDDDLVRVVARTKALQEFLATDDGINLLAAYKRAANIVGIEEKKDGILLYEDLPNTNVYEGLVDPLLLNTAEEKNLYEALTNTRSLMKDSRSSENFIEMMSHASRLRNPIYEFFENVHVNTEDSKLRANRLGLLSYIRITFNAVANFSLIEG